MLNSNSSKPTLQRLLKGVGIIIAGFGFAAGLWGNISDSIDLINTKLAIILTSFLLICSLVLWIWARYKGIEWDHDGYRVFYKKFTVQAWLWIIGILLAIWIGPVLNYAKNASDKNTDQSKRNYTLACDFPKTYNLDTLYILVTRFEADFNKVETACFGKALRDRIDAKANQHKIPIKICYSDSLYPQTHTEAKQFQKRYYADLVLWGDISNVKQDCSNGDFCFYSQPSDSLIKSVGGRIEIETDIVKYQKDINPEKIREGNFNIKFSVKDYSFDKWLLSVYNIKIGINNPDLYVVNVDIDQNSLSDDYLQRGNFYSQLNKFDKAVQDYGKAIKANPTNVQAYVNRGKVKDLYGAHSGAIQDYDKALQIDPDDVDAYFSRGNARYVLEYYDKALQDYNKAIQIDPNKAEIYNERGNVKDILLDSYGAIQDYNKAIQINPNVAIFYLNRGITKDIMGDKSGALQDYDKTIQIDLNSAQAYTNRGNARDDLGNHIGAFQDYDKAIQIDPGYTLAYLNRGITKELLGDYNGAIQDHNRAIQLSPNNAHTYYNRGNSRYSLGDKNGALQDYNKAIQIDPNNAHVYYNRGTVKYNLGDKYGAFQDYSEAHRIDPNDVNAYSTWKKLKDQLEKSKVQRR